MKNKRLALSLLTAFVGLGLSTSVYADCKVNTCGSSAGQVQSMDKCCGGLFSKGISKTITLSPGQGQISLDKLGWRDVVTLTLVNPSNTPLQFETTQRWGKQYVSMVPAHGQEVVSFRQTRPFTNDVKFLVMQQPDNAIATNQDYYTQQVAAVAATQEAAFRQALDQQTAMIQSSQEEAIRQAAIENRDYFKKEMERRSAVRGYW